MHTGGAEKEHPGGAEMHTGGGGKEHPGGRKQASITVPEIRRFRKSFATEILCASPWGANLLIGTRAGLVLLDRSGSGQFFSLINRRKFTQILVMESLGVMLAICGKHSGMRMYFLAYFKAQVLGKSRKGLELYEKLPTLKNCSNFTVTRHENMRFLAVTTKHNVTLLLWAPKPYFRFLLYKDFAVPHVPLLVDIKVSESEELKIVFASALGFHSVDVETGNVLHMHLPRGGASVKPHAIVQMPRENDLSIEYFLCYDSECLRKKKKLKEIEKSRMEVVNIFFSHYFLHFLSPFLLPLSQGNSVGIDSYGDVILENKLSWETPPSSIGASPLNLSPCLSSLFFFYF